MWGCHNLAQWWEFLILLWQYGGDFLSADRQVCTLDSRAAEPAAQCIFDLVQTHKVHPAAIREFVIY